MERAETHRLIHTSIIFTNLGVPWYFTKPHFYQMVYDGYPFHTLIHGIHCFETLNYLFYRSTPDVPRKREEYKTD